MRSQIRLRTCSEGSQKRQTTHDWCGNVHPRSFATLGMLVIEGDLRSRQNANCPKHRRRRTNGPMNAIAHRVMRNRIGHVPQYA